jgi:hypothetical protein
MCRENASSRSALTACGCLFGMTDYELTLAIRDMYRRAVTTHRSDDLASRACMTVLPIAEADARSMIARMTAEEPAAQRASTR